MKAAPVFLSLLILLSLGAGALSGKTAGGTSTTEVGDGHAWYGKGCRYNTQGWIFVHIEGDPYERGYQYGYLLSPEIVDMISRWSHIIHNAPLIGSFTGDLGSPRYNEVSEKWWEYCKAHIAQMYWKDYPLEYQKEIEGIAQGVTDNGGQIFGKTITSEDILAINEMYEFITKLGNPEKGIHFLRSLFHGLQQLIPGLSQDTEDAFVSSFVNQSQAHHCTGFIATGDATTNGQIVVTQATWFGSASWWFNAYIAERWNVIVDLQPSQGNRLLFSTAPGYIWSDENYYQNEKGIVIVDTTAPQGIWALDGLPLAVRTRKAAQYSETIDDVIAYLLERNDGVWTAVWLIGDTKTGEIARMDLGLYNHGIWRTQDGFYWSTNNIMDIMVRSERRLGTLKGRLLQILGIVYPTTGWYEYYTREYHPNPRDIQFEELGQKYYGDIDAEWLKGVMSVSPFTDFSADTKVSDSSLIAHNGLWAHWGNPGGIVWNTTPLDAILPGGSILPPSGWVRLYGLPNDYNYLPNYQEEMSYGGSAFILWEQETWDENPENTRYAYSTVSEGIVYSVTSMGVVHAYDAKMGSPQWTVNLGGAPTGSPAVDNLYLVVGLRDGLYVLNRTTGDMYWNFSLACVAPLVITNHDILVGCETQLISFDLTSGDKNWVLETPREAYPSTIWKNWVFVGTGSMCWAVDSTTGEIGWIYEIGGPVTTSPGVSSQGIVYVGSWDTHLYALDGKTGEKKWVFQAGWGIDVTPAIRDNRIFVGSMDHNFYAIDAIMGDILWVFSCRGGIHSSPLVYGDYVFFGSDDGRFYALHTSNGDPVWSFSPGYSLKGDVYNYITTPILASPVAFNGTVFMGIQGKLYALDAQTSEKIMNDNTNSFGFSSISESSLALGGVIVILVCLVFFSYAYIKSKKRKST